MTDNEFVEFIKELKTALIWGAVPASAFVSKARENHRQSQDSRGFGWNPNRVHAERAEAERLVSGDQHGIRFCVQQT